MITPPLNSPLEVGLRVVFLLGTAFPQQFDLHTLVRLDHLLLHTELNGGPPSIHPELPGSIGELSIKPDLVRAGLDVMLRAGLAEVHFAGDGFLFAATDDAVNFIRVLNSSYANNLRFRAGWLFGSDVYATAIAEGPGIRQSVSEWAASALGNRAANDG